LRSKTSKLNYLFVFENQVLHIRLHKNILVAGHLIFVLCGNFDEGLKLSVVTILMSFGRPTAVLTHCDGTYSTELFRQFPLQEFAINPKIQGTAAFHKPFYATLHIRLRLTSTLPPFYLFSLFRTNIQAKSF
jgi:hypothetical protein